MKNDLSQAGYDKEAEYFHNLNKDLIAKKRSELSETKQSVKDQNSDKPYWMMCPKCGNKMVEKDYLGVKIDECSSCQGIYFDSGELDLVLESQEPRGFFSFLKKKS